MPNTLESQTRFEPRYEIIGKEPISVTWNSGHRGGDTKRIPAQLVNLSQTGVGIATRITELTGIPTYYYLYRYGGRSLKSERERKCPGCDGEWLLVEALHEQFDFKCDHCRLVSHISLCFR